MASSSTNRNQMMDVEDSSSVNMNPNQGLREKQEFFTVEQIESFFNNPIVRDEVTNLLRRHEAFVRAKFEEERNEQLKLVQEKYTREMEEGKKEIVELKKKVKASEQLIKEWKGFGTYLQQMVEKLRGTVPDLHVRIYELEARVREYEHNKRKEEDDDDED